MASKAPGSGTTVPASTSSGKPSTPAKPVAPPAAAPLPPTPAKPPTQDEKKDAPTATPGGQGKDIAKATGGAGSGKGAPPAPPPGEPATSQSFRDEFTGKTDGLADHVKAAKVKSCPWCKSDNLSAPSQYLEVDGRVALGDGQTYRGHWWFAESGEAYTPPVTMKGAKASD